jgi:pimeloyl-ACP methyl ester carboxylesterase
MFPRRLTFTLILILLTACGSPQTTSPVHVTSDIPETRSTKVCGDGICDGPENSENCPVDCDLASQPSFPEGDLPQQPGDIRSGEITRVSNPTSGAELSVLVFPPEGSETSTYPTLVLVPGGSGSGEDFTRPGRTIVQRLNEVGYLTVLFDPDGRGRSEGVEDNNGHIHQDGLASVIRYAADHPSSDGKGVGLISYSFGITMCSGALARHPDLPVRFLIDWEGPADRNDTGGCDEAAVGHLSEIASCDDEVFWSEREAQTFIGQVPFPYLRLQSEVDHVQPDVDHALRMVNAAVEGASPWVRLNELPINQTYDPSSAPPLFSEDDPRSMDDLLLRYVPEMFGLH